MKRRDGVAPRLDPVVLHDLEDGDEALLATGARLEGLRFADLDATGRDLRSVTIDECLLTGSTLDDAVLDGGRFSDSVLDGVAATALRGRGLVLRDVRLEGCRIGAAEWYEAELSRVELIGCRIDYLALADGTVEDVRFVGCTLGDVDLRGATVRRTAFEDCRLRELSARDARLTGLDLRGADLDRIDGVTSLAGAIVSDSQLPRLAPLLAEALGISVVEAQGVDSAGGRSG